MVCGEIVCRAERERCQTLLPVLLPFFRRDVEPQGLQPQDNNDKPTRPFSSLLESQTDHVLQLSRSRSRKGEGEAAEEGLSSRQALKGKCKIKLCP